VADLEDLIDVSLNQLVGAAIGQGERVEGLLIGQLGRRLGDGWPNVRLVS
jgi:hypothetical protein